MCVISRSRSRDDVGVRILVRAFSMLVRRVASIAATGLVDSSEWIPAWIRTGKVGRLHAHEIALYTLA